MTVLEMIIGIDTSCYTTSVAAVDMEGALIEEERRILSVPAGSRGLSQSAALFQHVREGREVLSRCLRKLPLSHLRGVCVSNCPRPLPESYMPVFLAGVNAAELLSAALDVPLFDTSHQEGHLMAGQKTAKMPPRERFLAVHLSGGTTELLLAETKETGFSVKILGGSNDLHAGQLVDRVGVALGLPFPCGQQLDRLACQYEGSCHPFKKAVQGCEFSLSGAEAEAMRQISKGTVSAGALAKGIFALLADSLAKVILTAAAEEQVNTVLLVGGVSGSHCLARQLQKQLENDMGLYFAPPRYARDNAYGVALLGLRQYEAWKKKATERNKE